MHTLTRTPQLTSVCRARIRVSGLAALLLLVCSSLPAFGADAPLPHAAVNGIAAGLRQAPLGPLIRQLGAAEFERREAAYQALLKAGDDALAALESAEPVLSDPEIKLRVARLLKELRQPLRRLEDLNETERALAFEKLKPEEARVQTVRIGNYGVAETNVGTRVAVEGLEAGLKFREGIHDNPNMEFYLGKFEVELKYIKGSQEYEFKTGGTHCRVRAGCHWLAIFDKHGNLKRVAELAPNPEFKIEYNAPNNPK